MEFSTEEQLKQLERGSLSLRLKAEEYEEAAVCRDRIKGKALKEEGMKEVTRWFEDVKNDPSNIVQPGASF